jgi:hypothetical protein
MIEELASRGNWLTNRVAGAESRSLEAGPVAVLAERAGEIPAIHIIVLVVRRGIKSK